MTTSKMHLLPPKLNLEMVAAELDLPQFSMTSQLEAILHQQREGNLVLKSSVPIDCNAQETLDGLDEEYNANGDLLLLSRGKNAWIETRGKPHILGPACFSGDSLITIRSFTFEEKEYYPLDEPGMHPVWLSYNISDIYVERANLEDVVARGFEELPAYADPEGEHYAPELALAVRIHESLRVKNEVSPQLGMYDRVVKWLIKNQPEGAASADQIKRLSYVVGYGKRLHSHKISKKTIG
ncbi:MAG: hypothetical protein DRR42_28150 [Gammaproteobacteria bacterium]|nr:MAG: hypothetical protein DRR42_28150 [Gammaproteobacteria bacterium]